MNNLPALNPYSFKYLRIIIILALVFVSVYYVSNKVLDQLPAPDENKTSEESADSPKTYSGLVKFYLINPYINEGVRYYLQDKDGKELYLLKSSDDKLAVAEGQWVDIIGTVGKTQDGSREVLIVDKIIFSGNKENGSN